MERPLLPLVLVAFLLALLPGAALAQAPAALPAALQPSSLILQGTVLGPDGRAVADARVDVRLQGSQDEITFGDTLTDVDGKFALLGLVLEPEHYVIHASAPGLEAQEQPFAIDKDGHASATEFTLKLNTQQLTRDALKEGYNVVRVFYATDRAPVTGGPTLNYAADRSGSNSVSYGMCEVSIPPGHQFATVEKPHIWRLEFHSDPEKHLTLRTVTSEPRDRFFQDVAKSVAQSPGKEAFVFVHGYNVSFESAALRTAQLTYDLGFKGAPIFYDWPSRGSLVSYLADENSVGGSIANLHQFLEDVANRSGATVIHVIAHSMGNRALLPAMAQLANDRSYKSFGKFHDVVLAAPDVDKDAFTKWVAQIKTAQTPVTLYVSDRDQALLASQLLFRNSPRAGEGGPNAIVMRGVDTIDVSKVSMDALGHSYYGSNPTVVTDLLSFLRGKPMPRQGLTRVPEGSLAYWLMNPGPG